MRNVSKDDTSIGCGTSRDNSAASGGAIRGLVTKWHLTTLGCLLLALVSALHAQTTGSGVIQGTVKDPTGAVIAATKITVGNVATSQQHTTTTNAVGFYLFPALLPGDYTLSAEAAGM